MGDIAQTKGDAHAIEIVFDEGLALGVSEHVVDVADEAAVDQGIAAAAQHGVVDVGGDDETLLAHALGEAGREVARAGGDVQHTLTRGDAVEFNKKAKPQTVHTERQKNKQENKKENNQKKHPRD